MPYNLGYACINETLKKSEKICINRSCIARTYDAKGVDYVVELVRINLNGVLRILDWNDEHGIKLYRLSSDMFPHITNPKFLPEGFDVDDPTVLAYPLEQFSDLLEEIGKRARQYGQRLTFHPGQYNQVGAVDLAVFQKTARELYFHARVLDLMGMGRDSVMVVHGGGMYGDKKKTIVRWCRQFKKLPKCVRRRIVLENDEKCYSTENLLPLCQKLKVPLVFDTHHYDCYTLLHPDEKQKAAADLMPEVVATWTVRGIKPKFHVSEQDDAKRVGAHSYLVEEIPTYLLKVAKERDIDIMIEAKGKELAVQHLVAKYTT